MAIAFDLSELFAAALVDEHDLPKLDCLSEYPSLAALYLVCDDLVLVALSRLRKLAYPRSDVFILDDSIDPTTKRLLDDTGFRIIRRQNRIGYKAGSLNNWLWLYGNHYKYFLVLDSDSIIPEGFAESIVKYAEHPANGRVAIFNSLSECWNTQIPFPRFLSLLTPLQNWIRTRLDNRCHSIFSTGHNNLHRSEAIIEVGGFDENFIAEDIATTLRLVRVGYTSRLVNLVAYEAEPEHIFSYVRRIVRWAKQTIQIHRANWQGIPLSIKFRMFRLTWMYISFFLYPLWAILAAWGTSSSLSDVHVLIAAVAHGEISLLSVLTPFAIIITVPLIFLVPKIPLLVRFNIPISNYLGSCLLSLSIAFYSMLHVCFAQIASATNTTLTFDITDKRSRPTSFLLIICHHWQLIPFWLFLAVGFWQNPISLFFSSLWVLVLVLAPLIICLFHGTKLSNIYHTCPELTSRSAGGSCREKLAR
jgi:cellulose synthase/poly-beta-1,6-N-acetylglucosamine synthase-like glycosyltransferase